jgi:hypothetical protein
VSPGRVFAGTNSGVFESTNYGVNWSSLNDGLMNTTIKSFTLDSVGILYVGTDEGVYRSSYSVIPVELTSFTANVSGNDVTLNWTTATETNNSGFTIERSQAESEWQKIGFVPGFGTTTEPKSYSFTDKDVTTGIYKYRLKQIDFDGSFTYSNEIGVEVDFTPKEFVLYQNYPNPFNPNTVISYQIPVANIVTLKIYDILGNEIATLINEEKQPGVYEVEFNATNFPSGIYFYRLQAGPFVEAKKMILLK